MMLVLLQLTRIPTRSKTGKFEKKKYQNQQNLVRQIDATCE